MLRMSTHYRAETIPENLRKYGSPPYAVAVIHGGPGAPGEMAPVARELSYLYGVLEPLQTSLSIEGQVQELRGVLEKYGRLPVTLIGHSWGAWLSFIFAARYPSLVKKLILVASGPFEGKYARKIMDTRISRLTIKERYELLGLADTLSDVDNKNKDIAFARLGELMSKTDSFDRLPLERNEDRAELRADIHHSVWAEADELRNSGKLLEYGKLIQCPVIAIHGDYDPHPAEGVEIPLRETIMDFRFILLKDCGHDPWMERNVRDQFYQILLKELV